MTLKAERENDKVHDRFTSLLKSKIHTIPRKRIPQTLFLLSLLTLLAITYNGGYSNYSQHILNGNGEKICINLDKRLKTKQCSSPNVLGNCNGGALTIFSQFRQDYYLFTRHFSRLRRRGTYVDIAANHPSRGSNSFFWDACLGWSGVCVEANPHYHGALRSTRSCQLIPTCLSDKDGQNVSFAMAAGRGGITDTNKNMVKWGKSGRIPSLLELKCKSMKSVSEENNFWDIDYLSLDVEGHELMVLKGVDWIRTTIKIITVEVSQDTLRSIDSYLAEKGYKRHWVTAPELNSTDLLSNVPGLLYHDAIFVHKNVQFGNPN